MTFQEAVVIIPGLIAATFWAIKKALPEKLVKKYKKFIPVTAMAIGAIISLVLAFGFDLSKSEIVVTTLQGIVVGAAAVGYREAWDQLK